MIRRNIDAVAITIIVVFALAAGHFRRYAEDAVRPAVRLVRTTTSHVEGYVRPIIIRAENCGRS